MTRKPITGLSILIAHYEIRNLSCSRKYESASNFSSKFWFWILAITFTLFVWSYWGSQFSKYGIWWGFKHSLRKLYVLEANYASRNVLSNELVTWKNTVPVCLFSIYRSVGDYREIHRKFQQHDESYNWGFFGRYRHS